MTRRAVRLARGVLSAGLAAVLALIAAAPAAGAGEEADRAVARAYGLLRAGEALEAAAGLEAFLAERGSEAKAWFALGECRRDLLDYAAAAAAVGRARELDPGNPAYALALGNIHFVRLEKREAFDLYAETLRLDPNDAAAAENADRIRRERSRVESLRRRRLVLLGAIAGEAAAIIAALILVVNRGAGPVGERRSFPPTGRIATGQSIGSRL